MEVLESIEQTGLWKLGKHQMEYILNNEQLTVTFTTKGGTISSIEDSQGIEYLWQGDAAYWSGQAPVLFPICGGLRDDKALIGII